MLCSKGLVKLTLMNFSSACETSSISQDQFFFTEPRAVRRTDYKSRRTCSKPLAARSSRGKAPELRVVIVQSNAGPSDRRSSSTRKGERSCLPCPTCSGRAGTWRTADKWPFRSVFERGLPAHTNKLRPINAMLQKLSSF